MIERVKDKVTGKVTERHWKSKRHLAAEAALDDLRAAFDRFEGTVAPLLPKARRGGLSGLVAQSRAPLAAFVYGEGADQMDIESVKAGEDMRAQVYFERSDKEEEEIDDPSATPTS